MVVGGPRNDWGQPTAGTMTMATTSERANSWNTAIADAEVLLKKYQRSVIGLKRAIRAFQIMRDEGKPFWGEPEDSVQLAPTTDDD